MEGVVVYRRASSRDAYGVFMDEWCFDKISDYEFVPRAELRPAAGEQTGDWEETPQMREWRGVIVGALENFDDARRAVVAAIRKLQESRE